MKEPARAKPEFFEYAKYNIIEKLPSMLDEDVVRESGLFIYGTEITPSPVMSCARNWTSLALSDGYTISKRLTFSLFVHFHSKYALRPDRHDFMANNSRTMYVRRDREFL